MTELGERLWPEERDRPCLELTVKDETFYLTWANTKIQRYRTGNPEYDEVLEQFDHVLHRGGKKAEKLIMWTLDQFEEEHIDYLLSEGYPHWVDPIPDDYILDVIATQMANEIPEAIGPDFGQAA